MDNMELRFNSDASITSSEGQMIVEGYVNKTDQPSNPLGKKTKFIEKISKGAWTRALGRAKEIHFYAEHDKEKILASTRNGSLELREDENGLYMRAKITPTSWGKDYYQLISDGILQNMSFGFRSIKDTWKNMGTHYVRTVDELDLFEVSVVRDPAYSASSIAARGIELVEEEVPEEIVENTISIDLRANSDDIDRIVQKLLESLEKQKKKEDEPEKAEEKTEKVEEEKTEDTEPEKAEETEVKTETTDDSTEQTESEKQEEVEQVEDTEEKQQEQKIEDPKKESEAIRDFVNQFKNQEEK